MAVTLNSEQAEAIRSYALEFKRYVESPEGKQDAEERQKRITFYQNFDRARIEKMDESDLEALITNLWATRMWTDKLYVVNRAITENGIEKLRKEFAELLHGKASISARYDRFLKNIKGLGPASVTELLAHVAPKECGVWNDKARKALDILGFGQVLPVKKYRISAKELDLFNDVLLAISGELAKGGVKDLDLLWVDYFLYEVWRTGRPAVIEDEDFEHDELVDNVKQIGLWLGFDVETERHIAKGARVDVLWRTKIGNLGIVTYAFEVHKSGSIDSLIVNLQKAGRNPTVQKVVAVSDSKQLEKIRGEIQELPESFGDAMAYWQARDVKRAYENLFEAIGIIRQLELVKESFGVT